MWIGGARQQTKVAVHTQTKRLQPEGAGMRELDIRLLVMEEMVSLSISDWHFTQRRRPSAATRPDKVVHKTLHLVSGTSLVSDA